MKVIEFYSAWCTLGSDYKKARQEVARLLMARKNLRDFEPWQGEGVPKSSLDGRRESVRQDHEVFNMNGVRIKKGEALDLVGCVKRAAETEENAAFPSVFNVALTPWIRGLEKKGADMTALCEFCKKLVSHNVLSRSKGVGVRFPYDATALLPSRYHEFVDDASEQDREAVKAITEKMKQAVQELHKFHKPHKPMDPYLAVLVADGDRMGKAISEVEKPDEHREFSKTLSYFAKNAREIVERNFGCCVYTGGDDVLAFLPVDKAVPCARELRDEFVKLWKVKKDWSFKDSLPTLSVGISIAHALEDLEDLLKFGREAENLAKKASADKGDDDRNGLAVAMRARGNSELFVREQWKNFSDSEGNSLAELSLDQRLLFWVKCFSQERIPSRFPYELLKIERFYEEWNDKQSIDQAMRLDVLRILDRKKLSEEDKVRMEKYVNSVIRDSNSSMKRLAEELLAAQWIEAAYTAAGGD